MKNHRLIPALLLKDDGLVKTIKFNNPSYVGDPINAIRIFNEKEVDEILVIDITSTKEKKEPNYKLIEEFAGECFMPLTYGGGINNIDQAKKLFSLGVEKICLQSAAFNDPLFISDLVNTFGSQSIVISFDIKRNLWKKPKIFLSENSSMLKDLWVDKIKNIVSLGIGEILINCVDRDGTLSGPDLEIISEVSNTLSVPVIALGGISSLKDISNTIQAGASAVAAGSFFIYHGPHRAVLINYPEYENPQIKYS